MKTKICRYLSEKINGITFEEFMQLAEIPPEEKMGDYAFPCFALAKKVRKNPAVIASELKSALMPQIEMLGIKKVETVAAYCNVF